jgi:hypothetical protein
MLLDAPPLGMRVRLILLLVANERAIVFQVQMLVLVSTAATPGKANSNIESTYDS